MGITGKSLLVPDSHGWNALETGTQLWIRISTGQLCIEVNDTMQRDPTILPLARRDESISRVHLTSDTNLEEKLLANMSLDDIHRIFHCSGWWKFIEVSDPGTILLGSLSWPAASCAHEFNPFSEISLLDSLRLPGVHVESWECSQVGSSSPNEGLVIGPNGWTRVALADLPINEECHPYKHIYLTPEGEREVRMTWLSQANHIMDKSGLDADECYLIYSLVLDFSISSNLDEFTLQGTFMADSPTDEVYLFLFPAEVDNSGGHLAVHLAPENETYYWSFDPKGLERLPQDDLDELALPHVDFYARVYGNQWSQDMYDCIGHCHRAKGFNPTGQDVAIGLGYPLMDVGRLNNLINDGKIQVVDEVGG
ncbi:hypothetical protein B0H13DRAFT_1124491 [Mycena leptocephala]|nr:hypothetical protein B0H13DRAFT_1124491 [Mycena leptocephala]